MSMCPRVAVLAIGLAATIGAASARAATITFSEVPPQVLNGVTILGVTFTFEIGGIASTDATIGTNPGPGATPFNFPPNVEGNSNGILTLDFAQPVNFLEFGSYLSVAGPVSPGLTVQLYDLLLAPIGAPIPLNMVPSPTFAGGLFSIAGGPLFSRAVIDFQFDNTRFALDTVTFESVPEPATLVLLGSGLAAAAVRRRFRTSKRQG